MNAHRRTLLFCTLTLSSVFGLAADVTAKRDTWGVPHVFAETLAEVTYGQVNRIRRGGRSWPFSGGESGHALLREAAGRRAAITAAPLPAWPSSPGAWSF